MKKNLIAGLLTLLVLGGCAGLRNDLRHPYTSGGYVGSKCYEADSTESISRSDYETMFQDIGKMRNREGFAECDTSRSWDLKIKPAKSFRLRSSKKASTIMLGVDLATIGTGAWLTAATGSDWYLLISSVQVAPTISVEYAVLHKNRHGLYQTDSMEVQKEVWFKDSSQCKKLVLAASQKVIAQSLFADDREVDLNPDKDRVSISVGQLLHAKENGGMYAALHYERLLPNNLSLDLSPGAFIPFSSGDRYYWVEVGPRWYLPAYLFGKGSSGIFLGAEGYLKSEHDQVWSKDLGMPFTVGNVFQEGWLFMGLDLGVGPAYEWVGKNEFGAHSHFKTLYLGNIILGCAF